MSNQPDVSKWDDLIDLKTKVSVELINHINTTNELTNKYQEQIEQSDELKQMIQGLDLSFKDLGDKLIETSLMHSVSTRTVNGIVVSDKLRTGLVGGHEDQFTYAEIMGLYLSVLEGTVTLISVAYIEIISCIGEDPSKLQELIEVETNKLKKTTEIHGATIQ